MMFGAFQTIVKLFLLQLVFYWGGTFNIFLEIDTPEDYPICSHLELF